VEPRELEQQQPVELQPKNPTPRLLRPGHATGLQLFQDHWQDHQVHFPQLHARLHHPVHDPDDPLPGTGLPAAEPAVPGVCWQPGPAPAHVGRRSGPLQRAGLAGRRRARAPGWTPRLGRAQDRGAPAATLRAGLLDQQVQ